MSSWSVSLLSLLMLWSCAAVVSGEEGEDALVRCKHMMCARFCAYGYLNDERGCPKCDCEPNPCDAANCWRGVKCEAVRCDEDDCLKRWKAKCDEPLPCPIPSCANRCPFGYRKDERGCETCLCALEACDNTKCAPEYSCIPHRGKPTCVPAAMLPGRNPLMTWRLSALKTHSDCPMRKCAAACEFGYVLDDGGCRTCLCKRSPCEAHTCVAGFRCVGHHLDCGKDSCPVLPMCNVRSLCLHHHAVGMPLPGGGLHKPRCAHDGAFEPRQCHEQRCWCVNDNGGEIEHSRHRHSDHQHECHMMYTVRLFVTFVIEHTIEDIKPHMGDLKEAIRTHVARWLLIDEELIEVKYLKTEQRHLVVKIVVLRSEAHRDLPTSVSNLRAQMRQHACHFRFRDHVMRANADKFETSNEFGYENEPPRHLYGRMMHHVPLVIAGGLILFICLVLVILLSVRRRRNAALLQKRQVGTWRKNLLESLSFPNQPYKEMDESKEEAPELPVKTPDVVA